MSSWGVDWDAWQPDPPEALTPEAQTAAALETYRKTGVTHVEVSAAGDDNVCPACRAAEDYGRFRSWPTSRAEPAGHVGRAPADAPSQRLGIGVVAGGGDALNTQDNIRCDDVEHNDLRHVHNLT
jgi:hypothetical protein